MKHLEKRIRALEARSSSESVILQFDDGSAQELRGYSGFLLDLFCAACRSDQSPEEASQLELIHQSVSAQESGESHMIELIQGALNRPVECTMEGLADDA